MYEKGFLMGLAACSEVICTYRQGNFPTGDDGNRELLTCIETVSAAGTFLPSFIIYRGRAHFMGWHGFTGRATNTRNLFFSYSKGGWTESASSIEWLKQLFIPQIASRSSHGREGLLILDGHESHVTIEFIETCIEHESFLFCLLHYTTHFLQPLDVGLFGPLQKAYRTAVNVLAYAHAA